MDDELKIVIKAVLDDNAEKDLNSQLKNLKLDPISPDIKLKANTSKAKKTAEKAIKDINESISKKVIKNPVARNIFKEFGIKDKLDKEKITSAVQDYQNALKVGNKNEIVKSYDDLFAAIKGSFFNFTKSLGDHEQAFLSRFNKQKMYISPQIKGDLGKDNYKYYRQNLVGKLTTDPHKALSPDVLYGEIYSDVGGGIIPHPSEIINDSDRFQTIANKIIELRERAKATYDEEDILWNIGSDNEIKKRINDILSASNTVKETAKIVRPIIKNIKSDLVDMSDPHWRSIIENAPFDINEKPKRSIKVPFQIDLNNPDEVQMEMERIVSEFTKNKGKLIDYKISTTTDFDENENERIESLSAAVIKYRNELGETITKQLRWQRIGQEIDQSGEKQAIMGFAENYAIYSQNIEKATEKQEKLRISTEKLENKLVEYRKSFENLQIKADKSGVKLNPDNISSFEKAINNKDLEQARHLLSMLSKEWQGLNAAIVKDTPNTALENMNRYITKMPYAIETLEIKLKTLSNPSKELQDKVQNLKTGLENVYKSSSNDEKLANYGKLKQAITNVNAELTNQIKLQRELNQNANLVYDKQTFFNRIQTWINQNAEASKVFRNEIEKVRNEIENADKFKLTNLKKQFQEITTNAKAMGITSETIFEKIFGMFGKLSSMIFGGSFLIFSVNSLKEIYNNILSIDSALVNVKKVTDETDQTYKNLIADSSTWAVKLGTSIDKMMNTTADFVRHGYSLKDAFDLSKTAAIFKNVSYTDIGTASTNIISTMKAFKLEAKDSMNIIDKLNDVGNKFSISSAGLSEGLRVSAASLATANNTLDESLGLITAANEVIQDPREAGNAVKVLSLRLRNTKGKLEEIGESTEGMVESVTRLQTQLLNLTNGKVNIMANPDTFKSTYQIMKEIANVWDDLTDVKRANIIELIAGKHRANVITSIVKSMKTAEDVVNVSLNSQGSAMREQEKSMNSIHAKMEQIKASVQSLSTSVIDSGFVKFILDLGTVGVGNLQKLVDTFGTFSTILTAISTSMSLLGKSGGFFSLLENEETGEKSLGFLGKKLSLIKEQWNEAKNLKEKINTLFTTNAQLENRKAFAVQLETDKNSLRNYISAINHGVSEITAFEKTMSSASEAAKNYAKSNDSSSLSIKNFISLQKSLNSATKSTILSTIALTVAETALNAALTMGLSLAIEGLVTWFVNLGNAQQRAVDSADELAHSYQEQMKALSANSKNIQTISSEYEKLAKGVNSFGENISLTNTEYQRYNEIVNQIADMFPQLVEGRTAEGNAIIKQKGSIEALNKALKEQKQLANDEIIKNQEDIFKGFRQTSFEGITTWTTQKDALYKDKQILEILIKDIDDYNKLINEHANMDFYSAKLLKKVGVHDFDEMSPRSIFESLTKNKNLVLSHYRTLVAEINSEIAKIQPIMTANLENSDDYQKLDENVQNYVKSMVGAIDIATLSQFQNAGQMNSWIDLNILQPIVNNQDNVREKLRSLFSLDKENLPADEYILAVNSLVEEIANTLNLDPIVLKTKLGFSDISASIDETKNSLPELSKEVDSLNSSFDSIEKSINNMASSLSLLDSTIKNVTDGTYLSGQEVSKLILKYPELSDKILQTSKGYTFEIEVLQKLREEKVNEQKTAIQAEITITEKTLESIKSRLIGYQSEIGAINSVAEAKAALANIDTESQNENIFSKICRGITGRPQISKIKSDLEGYIDLSSKIENAQKRIGALNTSLSLVSLPNYSHAVNNASRATKDHNKALNDNKKALDNQKKALEDSQKAINNLLDMTVKMIKRQKENEKEALKESLDGYKKKIDLMKQTLEIRKDEYHYQKELSDKNFEINKIQNKLNALRYDDSAEAQKKRKELEEKLKKDNEDLQKFLYDNGVERQKKALDIEYKQFKDSNDKRIKAIDEYLKEEGRIRQEAMNLIQNRSQEFYDNLMKWNADYGDGMTSTVINAWNKAYAALDRFHYKQFGVSGALSDIASQISGISANIQSASNEMHGLSGASQEAARALGLAAREYRNLNREEKENEIARLQRIIESMSADRGAEPALGYYKRRLYSLRGYAKGTYSAQKGMAKVFEQGSEMILGKDNGKYRLMNEGDIVFNHEATKRLWDFANNSKDFIDQSISKGIPRYKEIAINRTYTNNSSLIINLNISGNADRETVNALKRESENIIKKAVETTFKTANKHASII